MNITYYDAIPVPTNNPSTDVTSMQTNTTAIDTLLNQDHFSFNNNAGGNHKWVHFKNSAAPGGLGANADSVFYANLQGGQSWPFWQNGLGSIQLLSGLPSATTAGRAFLPGGIIIMWDKITAGLNTTNLPVVFPFSGFPNNVFSIVLTPSLNDNSSVRMYISSGTTSKFGFTTEQTQSAHITSLYYIAIGN